MWHTDYITDLLVCWHLTQDFVYHQIRPKELDQCTLHVIITAHGEFVNAGFEECVNIFLHVFKGRTCSRWLTWQIGIDWESLICEQCLQLSWKRVTLWWSVLEDHWMGLTLWPFMTMLKLNTDLAFSIQQHEFILKSCLQNDPVTSHYLHQSVRVALVTSFGNQALPKSKLWTVRVRCELSAAPTETPPWKSRLNTDFLWSDPFQC